MLRQRSGGGAFAGAETSVAIGIAYQPKEVKSALSVMYQAYLRCGLIEPNPFEMRVTPYHLLPSTEVLVGILRGETTCTVTLVRDGELGLPMESIFPDEVAWRREQGVPIAEASCLADRRRNLLRSFPLVSRLMSFIIQCAEYRGADELLIAVHPRHGKFYQRYLGFRQIAKERSYEAVQGNPAIAMSLDIPRLSIDYPTGYKRVFGVPFRNRDLAYRPMPEDLVDEMSLIVDQSYADDPCLVLA
ncbi:MAG: N-acyl amino acid synthase FeeM domain-containing protein [Planctomycetota bacterium]|jgi:hypothetical protein